MPFYREFSFGDISVSVWNITESADELLSLSIGDYAAETAALRDGQRRTEWLAVRLLLERVCGVTASIVYNAAGKPSLRGTQGYISISHTRGFAVLAYSPYVPLGVDVELSGRNAMAAARMFVNDESSISLSGRDVEAKTLVYWCACEAIFKVVGDAGGSYKRNLFAKPFEFMSPGEIVVSLKGIPNIPQRDYVVKYLCEDNLLIALCVPGI